MALPTAAQVIAYARTWQGYRDNNGSKVWKLYAPANYDPSSFCGAGQGMLAKHFDLDLAPTTHQRIIYVPYVAADARAAGKWILSKDSKPGDWVIFSWGNGYHDIAASNADHIGMIVENDPAKSTVTTFEFNTTDGNGNGPRGAFLRIRSRGDIMGCVDRQHAYGKVTPPKPPTPGALVVDGYLGQKTLDRWGAVMGTHTGKADLIRAVQTFLNAHGGLDERGKKLTVDGVGIYDNRAKKTAFSHTQAGLQRYLGTPNDGVLDSPSAVVKVLQARLNKAKTGSKVF